jgi:anhydro-N-acetylmuramic acid kinase
VEITILGVMSGTSLDGLDLALCKFINSENRWHYKIVAAETIQYPENWESKLINASKLSGEEFLLLHNSYGRFIGKSAQKFLDGKSTPTLIASHGHTIFHQPDKQFTFQLGNGASIAAESGISTICDFRSLDVAMGGNGAPLVPIGDLHLFPKYDYCLNIGGFANISYTSENNRVAYDICPANIILNLLAQERGMPFDKNGTTGKTGNINNSLLEKLDNLDFYKINPPKSLGREWLEEEVIPTIQSYKISTEDKLRTVYEHIAKQISDSFKSNGDILITGGGAKNRFLIERIGSLCNNHIEIPSPEIIDFKEALIFAFLGALAYNNQVNCLASVTGAQHDNIGGVIYKMNN